MTIKKRLFISNVMMIVLPIILTVLAIFLFLTTMYGLNGESVASKANRISYVGSSEQSKYDTYDDISNEVIVKHSKTEGYVVVLPDEIVSGRERNFRGPLMLFIILVIIVYLTNRILTKRMFKSIMNPINVLVDGVHEIKGGNLNYRIAYSNEDEFKDVCDDFNEMAIYLTNAVDQQQKDEQSRKELIAGISHDLRTPLTTIKTYVEALLLGVDDSPEKAEHYLNTILKKSDELEYIIHQLFTFSKLDVGDIPLHLEFVRIDEIMNDYLSSAVSEYKRKGLDIELHPIPHHITCSIDVIQFQNVMSNILDNAVRYVERTDRRLVISAEKESSNIILTFQDNGAGVANEALEHLFQVFYQEDVSRSNTNQSSGLGLAISAKIIEQLDGTISASNPKDGGLAIHITLPMKGDEYNETRSNY